MSNLPPIVCDTGSSMIKCGLCTSETPSAQLPAAVARRTLGIDGLFFDAEESDDEENFNTTNTTTRKRQLNHSPSASSASTAFRGSTLVGYEALAAADQSGVNANYPLINGIVTDWDDMILVWDYAFKELVQGGHRRASSSKRMKLEEGRPVPMCVGEDAEEWLEELKGRKIVQTEAACNPTQNRERILTEMFER
ncbi:hypothetical protein Pmar_PMAR025621 [Perkinsus marinus ATCC 50983]|uniref:Actin n=1 Tax=Perkinsus marinus (strain ATCC 50983 / TXsc) TaxID=423536 RepID=C5KJQ8_PERM5|nr:hypothetical protein Pmar_PMAR025621 [Perkinsus marinus ATCC 50983]EER15284.1 hypothetical protein Pmar_PMAR025621 [Perkinsus marinus ATCC 50983]|eukprot:XP_002783488.1 hypothetical protein Pmar_PMAR025621 [Perkinsus marinus ATCC 50983]